MYSVGRVDNSIVDLVEGLYMSSSGSEALMAESVVPFVGRLEGGSAG